MTILLKPILGDKASAAAKAVVVPPVDTPHPEFEKKAIETAELWLALVDKGEYSRSWETAAEFLKENIERKDFVHALNASRKSLGEVKSRQLESKTLCDHRARRSRRQVCDSAVQVLVCQQEIGHGNHYADAGSGQEMASFRVLHQVGWLGERKWFFCDRQGMMIEGRGRLRLHDRICGGYG